jgi:hypothetical protein
MDVVGQMPGELHGEHPLHHLGPRLQALRPHHGGRHEPQLRRARDLVLKEPVAVIEVHRGVGGQVEPGGEVFGLGAGPGDVPATPAISRPPGCR